MAEPVAAGSRERTVERSALWRVGSWCRAKRRRRKILYRLRHADVVVVTHAKSGRTWLLVMISHLFHLKYGTPATEVIKFDNLHRQDARIPKLYFTRFTDLVRRGRNRRSCNLNPETKFIFLFRDPRDVVVSYYFHLRNRSTAVERAHKAVPDAALGKPIFDFVIDADLGLPHIIRLMNHWLEEMGSLEHALLLRYEDMRANPGSELRRVMAFLGHPCSDPELEQAVEFASFENLRKREATRFFATNRLRPTDSANPDTFKVRRGLIGGYQDYFDAEQLAVMDDMVESELSPRLGYHRTPLRASSDHGAHTSLISGGE